MSATAVAAIAGALLLWALASARLARWDVTGPMVLVALGALADAVGLVHVAPDDVSLERLAAVALALLLFSDAARVGTGRLRHDLGPPARLLGIGLPLTIVAGAVVAWAVLGEGWAMALLVGACLAPTDAGLGAAIVGDRSMPSRVRRLLNVESGLNDGIAAPVVTVAVALLAESELGGQGLLTHALRDLSLGLAAGVVVGVLGGLAVRRAVERCWIERDALPVAVLCLAVLAYAGALAIGGNGFIGAFVGGLAFGPRIGPDDASSSVPVEALALTELSGGVLGDAVWFLFGAVFVGSLVDDMSWSILVYAVLSLTVIRMAPVALALTGTRLEAPTVAFVGWFGPRGLASLVFAIQAVEDVGKGAAPAFTVIGVVVLVSVVAHGVSARPLTRRYAAWAGDRSGASATQRPAPVAPARAGSSAALGALGARREVDGRGPGSSPGAGGADR